MKTPKRTCRDCLFFTSYSSADPDGRCGEGCGTYGTHTKGSQEACGFFMLSSAAKNARRKRKNRIAQLKRTIARLTAECRKYGREYHDLWIGNHLKMYSPEWEAFILLRKLQTPVDDASTDDKRLYWLDLRKIGGLLLNAACLAALDAGRAEAKEAACNPENAENGQQAELPPTGGQQDCDAQIAENAKQENLTCTDAEQLTKRKGN